MMLRRVLRFGSIPLALITGGCLPVEAAELTIETRIAAERAIQRVYHQHTIGASRPFDEAVPRALSERRVKTYLKQSLALERYWHTRVSGELLAAELRRMARHTRLPRRLEELYAALDHDVLLLQECLARPALVNRLIRSFYASDERFASDFDQWWQAVSGEFDESEVGPAVASLDDPPIPRDAPNGTDDDSCVADDTWDHGALNDQPDSRSRHRVVWTGSEVLFWGGWNDAIRTRTGRRYDPATDTWKAMAIDGAPQARIHFTAVWTGNEMIVWGGSVLRFDGAAGDYTDSGGRYDPLTDSWTPTSLVGAPEPRDEHTAVWTGDRMIVWGGYRSGYRNTGGVYDPTTDSWTATSTPGAPLARGDHTAVWTGSKMVVWGGFFGSGYANTGGLYDPATDTWEPTETKDAPPRRTGHTAVWTGSEMIVWGGRNASVSLATGGVYDPEKDRWQSTSVDNAPSGRSEHVALWAGDAMLVWGGYDASVGAIAEGARYDPDQDAWTPISPLNEPAARYFHAGAWTGAQMVVWAGLDPSSEFRTGGRYDPLSDTWTPTSTGSAPPGAERAAMVWTGTKALVWGGSNGEDLGEGGAFDPVLDSWAPLATLDAPSPRSRHTAVWSGEEMLVWGGGAPALATGARYDPVADRWWAIDTLGAPAARRDHSAVWSGREMLVWGGWDGTTYHGDGGRYDPDADTWQPLSTAGAPVPRHSHTAVWAWPFSGMIVWGGRSGTSTTRADGARYDPSSDSWEPIPTPSLTQRDEHTAVWSGREMIVWGGGYWGFDTGSRYSFRLDRWDPVTLTDAPQGRTRQAAVWSGSEMIVWGGYQERTYPDPDAYLDDGGRYDPSLGQWTRPTSMAEVPLGRENHAMVWTGAEVLVWGGSRSPGEGANRQYLREGGIYAADTDGDGVTNRCDTDDDGDGVEDALDCAPADDSAWSPVAEITGLRWAADKITLEWDSALPGQEVFYDLHREDLGSFPVGTLPGDCLASYSDRANHVDASLPGPGSGYRYLARARNNCGTGPWGSASDATPRAPSTCP